MAKYKVQYDFCVFPLCRETQTRSCQVVASRTMIVEASGPTAARLFADNAPARIGFERLHKKL